MTQSPLRLSVPAPRSDLPRPLTGRERTTCSRVADILCTGPQTQVPIPSQCDGFQQQLDVAVATRSDQFDLFVETVSRAGETTDLNSWLRELSLTEADAFNVISTVVAGAYLMVPEIREHVGYPGQHRDRPSNDQAAEELMDGILNPVIDRGAIYVPTPLNTTAGE